MTLPDSDVLIEVQRGRPKALDWLSQLPGSVALPTPVALELLMGSRNKEELEKPDRFLASFDVLPLTVTDGTLTRDLVVQYRLGTGLGLPDFLIAAQSINRSTTLCSFNLRHLRRYWV